MNPDGHLLLLTASFPFGPGESFLADEIRALATHYDRVTICPVWPRGELRSDWPGSDLTRLSLLSNPLRVPPPNYWWRSLEVLARHFPGGPVGGSRWPRNVVGVASAIPVLEALHRSAPIDHVHAYWLTVPATVAQVAASELGIAWSATAHRWDIYADDRAACKTRSASFIRTVSIRGRDMMKAKVPEGRVFALPLGVADPSSRLSSPPIQPRVVCPANLVFVKGHRYLLEAAGMLRQEGIAIEVDFAGDGPLMQELRDHAIRLGVADIVRFHGQIPHAELMAGMDAGRWRALVLPSLEVGAETHEGVPISLVEAMKRGLPVLSTSTGSIPELLSGCSYGAMVAQRNARAIASGLRPLLLDDDLWAMANVEVLRESGPWDAERTARALASEMQHPPGVRKSGRV